MKPAVCSNAFWPHSCATITLSNVNAAIFMSGKGLRQKFNKKTIPFVPVSELNHWFVIELGNKEIISLELSSILKNKEFTSHGCFEHHYGIKSPNN